MEKEVCITGHSLQHIHPNFKFLIIIFSMTLATYADLLPGNINSILMPCTRGYFYSYRVYATNAGFLSAKAFSPYSDSWFAACEYHFYIYCYVSDIA